MLRITRRHFVLGSASFVALGACGGSTTDSSLEDAGPGQADGNSPETDSATQIEIDGGPVSVDSGTPDPLDGCVPPDLSGAARCIETSPDQLGPYYRENPPFRTNLEVKSTNGVPLRVVGRVLSSECTKSDDPGIADALVDVWQADDEGVYDNETKDYQLRGKMNADSSGDYAFMTVLPGYYATRPQHIHFMISAPGYETLVTQLYFRSDPRSAGIDETLLTDLIEDCTTGGLACTFNIVLRAV